MNGRRIPIHPVVASIYYVLLYAANRLRVIMNNPLSFRN